MPALDTLFWWTSQTLLMKVTCIKTQNMLAHLSSYQLRSSLTPPQLLISKFPITDNGRSHVLNGRSEAVEVIIGLSDRLLVVRGPCYLHNPATALEYANRLQQLS
ncbi:hypothetical protein F5884DRAFT_885112 [Xylogone sp. PMI_703]|nr:hypothetical protein F5884DRAFT_885112 [Xylogone sp. PMI_703]